MKVRITWSDLSIIDGLNLRGPGPELRQLAVGSWSGLVGKSCAASNVSKAAAGTSEIIPAIRPRGPIRSSSVSSGVNLPVRVTPPQEAKMVHLAARTHLLDDRVSVAKRLKRAICSGVNPSATSLFSSGRTVVVPFMTSMSNLRFLPLAPLRCAALYLWSSMTGQSASGELPLCARRNLSGTTHRVVGQKSSGLGSQVDLLVS